MAIQINNNLRDRAYDNACKHGFHDKEYSDEHWLMLILTEIGEAVNAHRKGKHADVSEYNRVNEMSIKRTGNPKYINKSIFNNCIKDSVEDELADVVIRCLDFAGLKKIDIEQEEYKCKDDGSSFTDKMYWSCYSLCCEDFDLSEKIGEVLIDIFQVASCYKIDLLWFIEQKMRYNELREPMHGKKY